MTALPRHDDRREPEWKHLLREALGDVLLDVRAIEEGGEYDFLLVHPPGKHRAAIDAFATAILRAHDIPPHVILTAEKERAGLAWYRDYKSVVR